MSVDIHLQVTTSTARYAEIISGEIRKVFKEDDVYVCDGLIFAAGKLAAEIAAALTCLSLCDLRAIVSMRADLAGLSSQFVRAVAAEALGHGPRDYAGSAPRLFVAATPAKRDGRGNLDATVLEDWAGSVAGATYLEEKLRIPRSTLHRWYRRNEVVALRKGSQRHVFPLAQFVDGRPASGIREVLSHITQPRLAWFWMVHPSPLLDGRVPIDLLRQDMVSDVAAAAREHSTSL